MIKTLFIMLWIILETFVLGIIAIVTSFFVRTGDPIHKIANLWAKLILFVSRIKVSVNGLSNIDPSASYIYMCNHQSNFDIPVLLSCIPVQFRWLAKAELFKIPIFGRSMRAAGYISIDRFNRASAIESISEAAKKIKHGASVMIFPLPSSRVRTTLLMGCSVPTLNIPSLLLAELPPPSSSHTRSPRLSRT